jgi:hypothetical protein
MSEKYLGGIECVRALMAPAKQTINDKVVVPSSSDVQLRCNLILEETLEFLEACLGKTDDFFEYLSAIRFAADGIRNTKTEIVDVDLEEAFDAVVDIEVIFYALFLYFERFNVIFSHNRIKNILFFTKYSQSYALKDHSHFTN